MNNMDVERILNWTREFFKTNTFAKGAVLGMSGGKDSFVTAGLLVRAIGADRVFGVIMPNGKMVDLEDAKKSCELLGIRYAVVDIAQSYNQVMGDVGKIIKDEGKGVSTVSIINTAPRLRMTYLYAIAGSLGYLVANTSNLSESMVGYTTKWGDNVGDFSLLANFTKSEVCEIGLLLGLPKELVLKTPSDGLSGKSDEDNMGISYKQLERYIRNGEKGDEFNKINELNKASIHKRVGVIKYDNNLENHFLK